MWIKKEEYEFLKDKALKLEDAKIEFVSELEVHKVRTEMAKQKCSEVSKELYEIKKDLEHYLNTNEEKGVVYIPKFVVEKIVYGEHK